MNTQTPYKTKKTLAETLLYKYVVIVRDEENFAAKMTFSLNYARLILAGFVVFTTIFITGWFFAKVVFAGKDEKSEKEYVLQLMDEVQKLQGEVEQRDKFLASFQKSLAGEKHPEDNKVHNDSNTAINLQPNNDALSKLSPIEAEFRQKFENGGEDIPLDENTEIQAMIFKKPLKGVISKGFDPKNNKHYGLDIVSKKDEPVLAIADGTVIFSGWTKEAGYVIGLQHPNKLVSFYKHNSVLKKEMGEQVKAGETIAIVGNSGEYTDGLHLHLEIWHNGSPIDPKKLIDF